MAKDTTDDRANYRDPIGDILAAGRDGGPELAGIVQSHVEKILQGLTDQYERIIRREIAGRDGIDAVVFLLTEFDECDALPGYDRTARQKAIVRHLIHKAASLPNDLADRIIERWGEGQRIQCISTTDQIARLFPQPDGRTMPEIDRVISLLEGLSFDEGLEQVGPPPDSRTVWLSRTKDLVDAEIPLYDYKNLTGEQLAECILRKFVVYKRSGGANPQKVEHTKGTLAREANAAKTRILAKK